jgi:hypothetical protein
MRAQSVPVRKAISIRVHESLPVCVDLDELIHSGVLGLYDAVIKYDGGQNVVFHGLCQAPQQGRDSGQLAPVGLGVAQFA